MKTLFPGPALKTRAQPNSKPRRLLIKPLETLAVDADMGELGSVDSDAAAGIVSVRYRWRLVGCEQASREEENSEAGDREEACSEGDLEALTRWLAEQFGIFNDEIADKTGEISCHSFAAIELPPVCLIVPSARLSSKAMAVSAAELRHLRNLAPFELEDHVAVDIETLHVVCSPVETGQANVAGIDRQWLQSHYLALQALGLDIAHCQGEISLLPLEDNSWTLWLGDELLVRRSRYEGFALASSLATEGLMLAMSEVAAETSNHIKNPESPASSITDAPVKIKLLAPTSAHLQTLYDLLPEALRSQVSSQAVGDLWRWPNDICAGPPKQEQSRAQAGELLSGLELAQGPFARRLPWARCWRQGRSLMWLGSLSLAALLLANGLELYRHHLQQKNLQVAIEQTYRQVMPSGALVDAVKQLQHQRDQQGVADTQSEAVGLLARVVPLMLADEGLALKRLSYHNKRRELRLSIDARSFNQIEQLRSAIAAQGLGAQLVSANASQSTSKVSSAKHQARLKINW